MNKLLIDTNALLRFLLKDIPEQTSKVRNKFKEAKKGKLEILVPQIVIFEIVYVLSKFYGFSKIRVVEGIETILASTYLTIEDREIFMESIKLYKIQSISFVDCFSLCKAKHHEISIFTFDKKLKNMHKEI